MNLSHHRLHPQHIYQLEVIFLFVAGVFLFLPYLLAVEEFQKDITSWQWYYLIPWIIFYTIYSLRVRAKIPNTEYTTPLKRPIIHWVLLGIVLLFFHMQPIDLERLYGVDILFFVFTILLADGWWSFNNT